MRGDTDSPKDPRRPNRKSIRLPGYDYARKGAYFVTICTQDRKCLFGDVLDRKMMLNPAGLMVDKWYGQSENKFTDIKCDKHVIMPNHFHAIIQNVGTPPVGADPCVCPDDPDPCVCPDDPDPCVCLAGEHTAGEHTAGEHTAGEHTGSPLHRVIQWFKTMTTNEYIRGVKQHGWRPFPGKLWQRNYYEHIIRNGNEMNRIRGYILNNPAHWDLDRENPMARKNHRLTNHNGIAEIGIH